MASIATCPEREKKKLSNVFSNATAEMLESYYGITVPFNMKNYRVVIQDFEPQCAIIGSQEITKNSKFIFYDPNLGNKKDTEGHIIFYDREGKIINSIKVKSIEDIANCKKLKIVKNKAYKEKAIPAKYTKDELGKLNGSFSYDKLILVKKSTIHHMKGCEDSDIDSIYCTPITEFIGITLFNAALKKAGLSQFSTEYTLVKDESGKLYFDSTDARKDKPWKNQENMELVDLNVLKAIIIASNLCAFDVRICKNKDNKYLDNILQFIDDKNVCHHKIIDLGMSVYFFTCPSIGVPYSTAIYSWYQCFLLNKNKFTSVECRNAILEGFKAVSEIDVDKELQAIKPVFDLADGLYDIVEMSKIITDQLNVRCNNIKHMICLEIHSKDTYISDDCFVKGLMKDPFRYYLNNIEIKDAWESFCQETNLEQKAIELSEELKRKHSEKQSTSLAAPTESETMDTTSKYICGNII